MIQQEREAPQPGQTEHVRLDHQQQVSAKPVVQDVLAIHSDSGYASNDIARTQSGVQTHMGKVAIDAPGELPVASFADAKTYGSLPQQEPDYEVGSVLSDEDDNRSMGVSPKSRPVLEAQSQIRALFALNENLQLLAKDLLAKMGRERFVENFRRLLMSYYKLQKQLARSNLEHAVVVLLGSRTLREGIATQVADTLVPTSDQMRLDHEKDMERIRDTTASVEDWLSKNLAFAQHAEPLEQNDGENANLQHEDSSDSDDEHQADKSQVEFAHITRAAQFLCASNAVENLLLDMQVLSIPSELHILAQTLLTIPRDDVRIYCEYKPTFWNKCKIFVDEATNVDWNWWPLDPAIPPLPADRVRIWWKCVSAPMSNLTAHHIQLLIRHSIVDLSCGTIFPRFMHICSKNFCLFEPP